MAGTKVESKIHRHRRSNDPSIDQELINIRHYDDSISRATPSVLSPLRPPTLPASRIRGNLPMIDGFIIQNSAPARRNVSALS